MSDLASSEHPHPTILEDRWLHHVMVFFSSFDRFHPLINGLLLIFLWLIHYGLWRWSAPFLALSATAIFAAFTAFDVLLLWLLRYRQISYGGVASQFAVMIWPRLGVVLVALLLALWQPVLGLGVMIGGQLLGALIYLWATVIEPHQLALTTLTLDSSHLPEDTPPIRLLHLTDLHLERLTERETRLLTLIDDVAPDLILITGDYLNLSYNRDAIAISQVRELLAKIKAPFGVYATLGSPPVDVADVAPQHFAESHITLLRGDAATVNLGASRQLTLLGLDCSHDMAYDAQQLATLVNDQDRITTILLYHSPELMPAAQQHKIDLFLCGHTHGGQVRMPFYGAIVTSACTGKRYEMGRYDENGTTLYVSRGIGLEGLCAPRIRLLCPPEITLVTLVGTGQTNGS